MKQVFDHYDKDKSGRIHYKEFITEVMFREQPAEEPAEQLPLTNQPNSTKVELGQSRQQDAKSTTPIKSPQQKFTTSNEVIAYVKDQLRNLGVESLIAMAVKLKELDTTKSHRLALSKVESALNWLNHEQVVLLFSHFKLQPEGQLNYAEFAYSLIEKATPERNALVGTTFSQFADANNEVAIEELLKRYRDNTIVPKTVYDKAVALYCKFQSIDDGIFTLEDFDDFTGFLGFAFTSDERFRNWILKSYGEEDEIRSNKSSRSKREFQVEAKSIHEGKQTPSERLADLKIDVNIEPPKDAFKKSVAADRKSHQNRASHEPSEKSVKSLH